MYPSLLQHDKLKYFFFTFLSFLKVNRSERYRPFARLSQTHKLLMAAVFFCSRAEACLASLNKIFSFLFGIAFTLTTILSNLIFNAHLHLYQLIYGCTRRTETKLHIFTAHVYVMLTIEQDFIFLLKQSQPSIILNLKLEHLT